MEETIREILRRLADVERRLRRFASSEFGGGGGVSFNDGEGQPADVTTTSADGTSSYAARRDHAHTIANGTVTAAMIQDGAALAEILDDDGTGSGLDADLLDGQHAAAFAAAGHTHVAADVTDFDTEVGNQADVAANTAARHAAATLSAEADAILALTGQAIDLDVQNANKFWAGPETGADAKPTFRAIVAADLPALTETIEDTIGAILADTNSVNMTYTDATPEIKADVRVQSTPSVQLSIDASGVKAVAVPGGINHPDLSNLNSASYSHLTAAQVTDLTDAGATTLHKHDHGGQDGLADDDHTQYLLATGARAGAASQAQEFTNGVKIGAQTITNFATIVGDPGDDATLVTEQGIREALDEKADIITGTFSIGAAGTWTSFTEMLAAFQGKILLGVTVNVDTGTYDEVSLGFSGFVNGAGSDLTIVGDNRALAGHSFCHNTPINPNNGTTNAGSGTCALSSSGNNLTISGGITNPDFSGWVSGDKLLICETSGTVAEHTISSIASNVITLTGAAPTVNGNGATVTMLPNRRITPSSNGTVFVLSGPSVVFQGFYIKPNSTSYAAFNITGFNYYYLTNCVAHLANNLLVQAGSGTIYFFHCTAIDCTTGVTVNYVNAAGNYNFAIKVTYGFLCQYGGNANFAYCAVVRASNSGFYALHGGVIMCGTSATVACLAGFRSYYNSFIGASGTNALAVGNTANYSPATSDAEGNVSAIINWS